MTLGHRNINVKKIVTHSGNFHADELIGIAIAKLSIDSAKDAPIERVNKVNIEDLNDPGVMVIDVGGEYNPSLLNFDHHQDRSLSSACVLVAKEYCPENLFAELEIHLLGYVSDVDLGHIKSSFPSINNIVRMYDDFDLALVIVTEIVERYMITALESIEAVRFWNKMDKFEGLAVNIEGYKILNWKNLAKREDIYMMIVPSDRDPGWTLVSRDSDLIPIPPHPGQLFRHDSGFLATYSSFSVAYTHALAVIKRFIDMRF